MRFGDSVKSVTVTYLISDTCLAECVVMTALVLLLSQLSQFKYLALLDEIMT